MPNLESLLKKYSYQLPAELIAQTPAKPRDAAKLLVYRSKSGKSNFDIFKNLPKYLPKNTVLVFNQTRVIPARLVLKKPTGGKVEILYLGRQGKFMKALSNKKLNLKSELFLGQSLFKVKAKLKNGYLFQVPKNLKKILYAKGITPLPPYIKNHNLKENALRREYQTIFAQKGESVAAPTASLHFTKKLISKLKKQGILISFINLDVNLGTFAPLKKENLEKHKLHTENYLINKTTAKSIISAKKQGKLVIAVGTTVVRALESAFKTLRPKLRGSTQIFIHPPYKFKIVDGLITNFHVPKSSLMMLVAALIGRKKLLKIYKQAIKRRFRFFSFGDGMLIL